MPENTTMGSMGCLETSANDITASLKFPRIASPNAITTTTMVSGDDLGEL